MSRIHTSLHKLNEWRSPGFITNQISLLYRNEKKEKKKYVHWKIWVCTVRSSCCPCDQFKIDRCNSLDLHCSSMANNYLSIYEMLHMICVFGGNETYQLTYYSFVFIVLNTGRKTGQTGPLGTLGLRWRQVQYDSDLTRKNAAHCMYKTYSYTEFS